MSTTKLFNSKTAPIPRLRPDVDIIPIQNNGDSYLYLHDMRGYATPDFALDRSAGNVLSLLDGQKSINELKSNLVNGTTTDQLLQYVQFLDKNRLLYSAHFKNYAQHLEIEYEQARTHHSITAGGSYPAEPGALQNYLDEAFSQYQSNEVSDLSSIKALYAPHIDPRIGMESYVKAFSAIRHLRPKRVVILATSHYAGLYPDTYNNTPFIISNKDFEMPLAHISSDKKTIHKLLESTGDIGLNGHDRAHRIEHSIELHLLFLSYIWQHDFSIIPILVSGFDELYYSSQNHLSRQIDHFSTLLRDSFGRDDETFFLISGDLAHTGKKFGDKLPATSMMQQVKQFDERFLACGLQGSAQDMLQLIKQDYDPYRICGFPPLYTFLKTFSHLKGQQLSYDRWDETERESAVTFGSILYSE